MCAQDELTGNNTYLSSHCIFANLACQKKKTQELKDICPGSQAVLSRMYRRLEHQECFDDQLLVALNHDNWLLFIFIFEDQSVACLLTANAPN